MGGCHASLPLDIPKTVAEETLKIYDYLLSLNIDGHVIIGIRFFN